MPVRFKIWLLTVLRLAMLLPALARGARDPGGQHPARRRPVKAGPVDLRFRYNSRIDQGRSRLTLTRPDHSHGTIADRCRTGRPTSSTAHLTLTPGAYIVRWQVLAVDGHITRGDVPFTVTAP